MDLLIDTYGTFIGCTGERLVLRLPSKGKYKKKRIEKEYPIRRINKIVILRPSSISTHAVKLALEYEVDIVYLGSFGRPVGRIFSSDSKGLATTRRAQLEVFNDPARALALAKSFVTGKCRNQIYVHALSSSEVRSRFRKADHAGRSRVQDHRGDPTRDRREGSMALLSQKIAASLFVALLSRFFSAVQINFSRMSLNAY